MPTASHRLRRVTLSIRRLSLSVSTKNPVRPHPWISSTSGAQIGTTRPWRSCRVLPSAGRM